MFFSIISSVKFLKWYYFYIRPIFCHFFLHLKMFFQVYGYSFWILEPWLPQSFLLVVHENMVFHSIWEISSSLPLHRCHCTDLFRLNLQTFLSGTRLFVYHIPICVLHLHIGTKIFRHNAKTIFFGLTPRKHLGYHLTKCCTNSPLERNYRKMPNK